MRACVYVHVCTHIPYNPQLCSPTNQSFSPPVSAKLKYAEKNLHFFLMSFLCPANLTKHKQRGQFCSKLIALKYFFMDGELQTDMIISSYVPINL